MSARDELADLLGDVIPQVQEYADAFGEIADAILAAGYRKPRTITTAEELDGLAENTVIRDSEPATMQFMDGAWWSVGSSLPWDSDTIEFPATVLHEPHA